MNEVKLNIDKCKQVGELAKKYDFRKEYYLRNFLTFKATDEIKIKSYLFSVAICH